MTKNNVLRVVILMGLLAAYRTAWDGTSGEPVRSSLTNIAAASTSNAAPERADRSIDIAHLLGQFNPAADANFCQVEARYANRKGLYLRNEVYSAFKQMQRAAKKDGVSLVIVSATRTFDAQKRLWERKWTGARRVG